MAIWVDLMRVLIGLNILLLLGLAYIWGRNYREFRSKHTLGLLLFVTFMLFESALAMYFYLFHPVLNVWVTDIAPIAQTSMTVLRVFQFGALVFLFWVTWD